MKSAPNTRLSVCLILAVLLIPITAMAHTGTGSLGGWWSGLIHPLSGLDHLLAMVAVGFWAAMLGGRSTLAIPATFVGVMLLGGGLALTGFSLPFIETGILASVLVLGLLIAASRRYPLVVGMIIVGVFALFHGHAHGTEIPAIVGSVSYTTGFAVTTVLLHASGIAGGIFIQYLNRPQYARFVGAGIAAAGVLLFFV